MAEKWENKQLLDTIIENSLVDLYTSIAGITRGYISVTERDFGYAKKQAEAEMLKIDKNARKRVAKAYHIYDAMKDGEKG